MRPRAAPAYDKAIKVRRLRSGDHQTFTYNLLTRQNSTAALPRCATRRKLGTRKCKGPAGRQISMLSERAASTGRSSGNAAALARIYLSVRSAWTKRSLSRDARTLTRWPLGTRSPRTKTCGFGTNICFDAPFVSMRRRGQPMSALRGKTNAGASVWDGCF
jgi:hypothetical protein